METWVSSDFVLVEGPLGGERFNDGQVQDWQGGQDAGMIDRYFAMKQTSRASFQDEADFAAPYLGLMLRWPPDVSLETMVEWGSRCLLGGEDDIFNLEVSRTPGGVCERVDAIDELIPAPHSVLFRVSHEGRWFDPDKKLILKPDQPGTRMPIGVTLFVRRRTPGATKPATRPAMAGKEPVANGR